MKLFQKSILFSVFIVALLLQSCGINSNVMFKVPKGDTVSGDSIPMFPKEDYRISKDDKITFNLYTNDGAILVEASVTGQQSNRIQIIEYLVKSDGTVELPKVGNVKVEGKTVTECQDILEALYSKEYQNPFIQVRITNQRVLVFPGNGGDARIIPLQNNNTTLMEAIAAAGGITDRGRAKSIKLMRRIEGERKLFVIDLSTIDGLKYADMIVQANDYIYVEPNPQIAREVVKEVAPVVSILSSALVILTVFNAFK